MSKLIPTYIEQSVRVEQLERELAAEKEWVRQSTLSAQQRPWVGLTDDEITKLHHEIKAQLMGTYKTEDIYRAIEAKLREKNT